MAQLIKHHSNASTALELKMWHNGAKYIVYLGGIPVNIITGYATTTGDDLEDEYIMENNISQTEMCSTYSEAVQVYEKLASAYM